eukprot:scaffold157851_cov33-Tisochrysis_lutea.AAC.6
MNWRCGNRANDAQHGESCDALKLAPPPAPMQINRRGCETEYAQGQPFQCPWLLLVRALQGYV